MDYEFGGAGQFCLFHPKSLKSLQWAQMETDLGAGTIWPLSDSTSFFSLQLRPVGMSCYLGG